MTSPIATKSVSWLPTPTDAPKMYNETQQQLNNVTCLHYIPNRPDRNVSQQTTVPEWNDTMPDYSAVCTMGNASYVYPCCEAFGGELRLGCIFSACLIKGGPDTNETIFDEWRQCTVDLAKQMNESRPLPNCQPAYLNNLNLEDKKAKESSAQRARFAFVLIAFTFVGAVAAAL